MLSRLERNDKIGLIFFVALVLSSSLLWLFEERFDEEKWRQVPSKRYKMADDIIDSDMLIGKSKEETTALLGQPDETTDLKSDSLFYTLGKGPSFFEPEQEQLLILFFADNVSAVTRIKKKN